MTYDKSRIRKQNNIPDESLKIATKPPTPAVG